MAMPPRAWPVDLWSKLSMQPPPSKKLFSAKELLAELCQAALGSLVVDMSMVLWRRVTWDAPAKDWTPSLWVSPPPWLGSEANQVMSWIQESWTRVLLSAFMPSTPPWMLARVMVALAAQMS